MRRTLSYALLPLALLLTLLPALTGSPATKAAAADACPDVQLIFARGSGQGLGASQYLRFRQELSDRIKAPLTFASYELGEQPQGGHKYPAVNVSDIWNGNALGGKFTSGMAFDYGNSVWEGVQELIAKIYAVHGSCPNTRFITGGFSQGAQVIGQAYGYVDDSIRQRIVFQALFGDPKLYLPEGEGAHISVFGHTVTAPPACSGHDLSPWRRNVPDCDVDNGSLGARKPYLPAGWTTKTGLWCANHDFVCGSSKNPLETSGHNYAQDGGDMDAAAEEAVRRLEADLPADASSLDTSVHVIGTGTAGLDVVFVIDSTGSMSDKIDAAKAYAAKMADTISALRGRVALVEYRDAGDEFESRVLSGFDDSLDHFRTALDGMTADGGGDTPEATLAALMTAFDKLSWRNGAAKAAVVLTDAGFHDPDVATGVTSADVAARALQIDPVNVYPVVPDYVTDTYKPLADATSGQVITDSSDTQAALTQALTKISNRPVALLKLNEYYATPGQEVQFDASDSYATQGTVAKYEWDFDGDGTFDQTTTSPVVTHTYDHESDGVMQVRVTDSTGGVANASAPVHVLSADALNARFAKPSPATSVVVHVTKHTRKGATVRVRWGLPTSNRPDRWLISVNDVPVGTMPGSARVVTLTDVDRSSRVTYTVTPVSDAHGYGTPYAVRNQAYTMTLLHAPAKPVAASGTVPMKVRVRSWDPTVPVTGRVLIRARHGGVTHTIAKGWLRTSDHGARTFTVPHLAPGNYRVKALFVRKAKLARSKSSWLHLTVTRG